MIVGVYSYHPFPTPIFGQTVRMTNILKYLSKSNNVVVYCPTSVKENTPTLPVKDTKSLKVKNFNLSSDFGKVCNDLRVYRFLKNEYERGNFDILQLENSLGSILLQSKCSFPKVGVFHGRLIRELSYSLRNRISQGNVKESLDIYFRKFYVSLSEKVLACKSDRVIATSELVREYAIELGADANDVFVVSNGVDLKEYEQFSHSVSKYELRKEIGIPQDAFVFVLHGSLRYDQNIEAIKNIIKIRDNLKNCGVYLKNYYFLIVGGPIERIETLWKGNRTNPNNVLFTGYVEDVKPYLFSADCGIAPFPEDVEPGGPRIKILEFLAAGLPVLATKTGISGLEELIDDQPIYLIKHVKDLKKLPLGQEVKVNKKELVKFDWSEIAAMNEKILKETIENS